MSQASNHRPSRPEPPRAEPVPPTEAGETSRPSPRQTPAAPSAEPQPPARPAAGPAPPKKEKPLEDDESRKVLTKGSRAELAGAPEAVTCQPQVRAAPQPPSPCTHLLQNGAGRGPDPGGANGEAGNGVFRPLPSTQKPHRKLQSHHSINSQSSKKSKGSSKSASSHIPIEAQEGTGSPRRGPFPATFLLWPHVPWGLSCSILQAHRDPRTWVPQALFLAAGWVLSGVTSCPPKPVSLGVRACPGVLREAPGAAPGSQPLFPSLPLIPEGGFPPLRGLSIHLSGAVSPSQARPPCPLSGRSSADCCVHCILSCLFCEFLTLCNIVLDCATCGSCTSEDSCICCCCCNSGECADCDLPCDMDCGIIDACCESADCLEICMECCGLCFSS
ncbi:myoD family inhibitor isoform 1-T1 [Morphnus guianensis]